MFALPKLPYAEDALAPHISAQTMKLHHGKHHKAYIDKLNELLVGDTMADLSLEDVIKRSHGVATRRSIFNNAAQVFNHTFYWNCLKPKGGGEPTGKLAEAITKNFGSFATFKEKFTAAAQTQFGSGWAWLVQNPDGSLAIEQTANAGCPLTKNQTPLLTCDVWEHAYYIDYRNARPSYIEAFWKLINWDYASKQMK